MVASTPATLEDRIKNWKTRIEDVEDEEDKEIVEPALKLVIAKEKELGNDALTVDQLMEKAKKTDDTKDDIKAEKVDDKLENEQQKLSTSIAILFDYLGDVDSKVKNHTGKLLSQDALVKSGDKKLTLKTSTKDLSFVGHRAKETVSNKTGIIVSSVGGNKYTKAIDEGKNSAKDEYNTLNAKNTVEERLKIIANRSSSDPEKELELCEKVYKLVGLTPEPRPDKVNSTSVRTYRNDMRKKIASNEKFDTIDEFYTNFTKIIYNKAKLATEGLKVSQVTKISGSVFEEWIHQKEAGKVNMQEVIFNKKTLEAAGIDLGKDKEYLKGDGAIVIAQGDKGNTLVEAKNYEAEPIIVNGAEVFHTIDAMGEVEYTTPVKEVAQMENYSLLLEKGIIGYQTKNANGELDRKENYFTEMVYVFSNIHTLRAWSGSLFEIFKSKVTLKHGTTIVTSDHIEAHEEELKNK